MKSQNKVKTVLLLTTLMLSTILIAVPAYAADTGLKGPTLYVTGTTGNPPSNPGQALVDDVPTGSMDNDACALFRTNNPPSNVADSETYYNFSFGLPSGATIYGIEVVVSGYRTPGGTGVPGPYFRVRLDGGAGWTGYKDTSALTNVDAEYTLGSDEPLWGGSWTADSFSDTNFRLEIIPAGAMDPSTGEHWKLDSVRVIVYYTVAAAGFEPGDYFTYTQGGWGGPGSPGQILHNNFTTVYTSGVTVGDAYTMLFTAAQSVTDYLPAGGTPSALIADVTNPTSSTSGVFGAQVLALQINVDFSAAGITQGPGGPVGELELCNTGTSLDGQTIAQILAAANTALGGGGLPTGYSISDLNDLVDNLNKAFDNGIPSLWAIDHLCK